MTEKEKAADLLARFASGDLPYAEARSALIGLGVHPAHAEEMLAIARGESDVVGDLPEDPSLDSFTS
ncbi:hypothetical protein HNR46_001325 [Haloferula luteola]|uniref:Uncharacterized protein n=1 Tax=Haloferula luteola TaxID=595692 RepID=A0A840VE26_9BACT|nr:hypothetical protein [Haloferula luteola]